MYDVAFPEYVSTVLSFLDQSFLCKKVWEAQREQCSCTP